LGDGDIGEPSVFNISSPLRGEACGELSRGIKVRGFKIIECSCGSGHNPLLRHAPSTSPSFGELIITNF